MSNEPNPAPREPEPERRFDRTAMLLALVLAVVILGTLAYGIVKPSKVTSSIPLPNEGSVHRAQTVAPLSDPRAAKPTPAAGPDGPADRNPAAGR